MKLQLDMPKINHPAQQFKVVKEADKETETNSPAKATLRKSSISKSQNR